MTYLQTLKLPKDISSKMKKYLEKEAQHYTIYHNTLHRYNAENSLIRKVLNKKEAEDIMYAYHQHSLGGYLAYNNTLHKISSRFYWNNMNYVQLCHRCQLYGNKSLNEELYPVPVSIKPFNRIAMDVKHVQASRTGNRYIIVAIDCLTKYVEVTEITLFLDEEIICPTILITDNGKPFLNDS